MHKRWNGFCRLRDPSQAGTFLQKNYRKTRKNWCFFASKWLQVLNFHATIGNGLFGRRSVRTLRKGDLIRILAGFRGCGGR